jgi:type II restriction enzyme
MERKMQRLPIQLAEGQKINLSPGGQNLLINKIVKDLCSLFTPGGHVIYVGVTNFYLISTVFNGEQDAN